MIDWKDWFGSVIVGLTVVGFMALVGLVVIGLAKVGTMVLH